MSVSQLLKFGLAWVVPLEDVAGAWGARTVRHQDSFQTVRDRQSTVAPRFGGDRDIVLLLCQGGLDAIRREVAKLIQEVAIIDDDAQAYVVNEWPLVGHIAVVSGAGSYGYVYVTAILAEPGRFVSVRDEVRQRVERYNRCVAKQGRSGSRG